MRLSVYLLTSLLSYGTISWYSYLPVNINMATVTIFEVEIALIQCTLEMYKFY
jgi:hypothetical protein